MVFIRQVRIEDTAYGSRFRACVLREKRAAEAGDIKVSPGLLAELRSECKELAISAAKAKLPNVSIGAQK